MASPVTFTPSNPFIRSRTDKSPVVPNELNYSSMTSPRELRKLEMNEAELISVQLREARQLDNLIEKQRRNALQRRIHNEYGTLCTFAPPTFTHV